MTRLRSIKLFLRAWWQLVRFDLVQALTRDCGLVERRLASAAVGRSRRLAGEQELLQAMLLACCWYWKPVRCLQRSVCAVRLLRAHGLPARLVVGCRPRPFLSHAWVEIDGRVVNDSAAVAERLQVLYAG